MCALPIWGRGGVVRSPVTDRAKILDAQPLVQLERELALDRARTGLSEVNGGVGIVEPFVVREGDAVRKCGRGDFGTPNKKALSRRACVKQ
jgi:hypothetical protein